MSITEIVVGDRVLLQSSEYTREIAKIKGINNDNGLVLVLLSNGKFEQVRPQYIIKSFGQ